ncbi:HSP20-like chaperone, partial [Hesseltinella vesiculosa]
MPLHPNVTWAQRADFVYLTVNLSDIIDPQIDLTSEKFYFKAKAEKEQKEYECEIEFFQPINVEKSRQVLTARNLSMVIYKETDGWWDKLQKGAKLNFLKTDFSKWRDEDDEEDEVPAAGGPGDGGMADMLGGGGMDFSQFLNAPGMGNFDANEEENSSDEEEQDKPEETS